MKVKNRKAIKVSFLPFGEKLFRALVLSCEGCFSEAKKKIGGGPAGNEKNLNIGKCQVFNQGLFYQYVTVALLHCRTVKVAILT